MSVRPIAEIGRSRHPSRLAQPALTTHARLRTEALAKTAPWLAALAAACALAVLYAVAHPDDAVWLGSWAALLILVNWVTVRARQRAADAGSDDPLRSAWWSVAEAGAQAAIWAALPVAMFPTADPHAQSILAGAICTMMAGAVLLAVVPLAATMWLVVLATGLACATGASGEPLTATPLLLLPAFVMALLVGCLSIERQLSAHIAIAAGERSRRESVDMLLREYEEQGVGWLWQADAANLLTYASPRIGVLVGRSSRELIGQSLPIMFGCDAQLGGAMAAREPFRGIELEIQAPSGRRHVSVSGSPIIGQDGTFVGFRGVGSDITDVRRTQERLTQLAAMDVLTGLPNRQRMRDLFANAIAAAAQGHACAILFLDLDGFKPVNDTFGHPAGDAVLRAVSDRLAEEVAALGQVGRVGGDEFAILLNDGSSRRGVEDFARKLIARISEPYPAASSEIRLGVSIGIAFAPVDGSSVDELLLKADLALYDAKSAGRGTVRLFDSRMQRDAEDRLRLEQDLRQALARREFELFYQPVVNAESQAILGFEALLRWRHPERGMVPPAQFIPIAEETGLIAEIGGWVIQTACHDAMQWPDSLFVAVNLSPRQLVVPALPNTVSEALLASRLPPNRLELEVTEGVFLADDDGSLDVLRRVRSLGVGIALDDFGTGYSSLGYLNKTIFHTLKIDGSFVRDAGKRSETVSIIRAIVALANSFRMTITAEGVETAEDFERMRDFGCHKLQGYLFGRPMPHAETLKLVGTRWGQDELRG
ncbi:EAL domain-containing protein [Sphingomonas sp. 1P06PA]|uniref:putative bifunctional diguanylate cyclase/phosphodiesterase n=1 Tax=Sphingomonas sp. 1P06PA TaxID=554121 RepID=UPI0039A6B62F